MLSLVAASLLAWRTIEADLWGHIQYGEDWLHAGKMPRTATHTFSTPDYPWVNHENLFELAIAWLHRKVDGLGLMLLKCLAGMWLLSSMVRAATRQGVPLMTAFVSMIPVAWGLAEFWLARPQLFSFIFFGLMLVALEFAFTDWKKASHVRYRWLWCCIPLMIAWTNSHGGFAAGLCVLLAVLGLRSLQLWGTTGRESMNTIRKLGLVGVIAVLSVLINPYGYELPWWMIVSLSQPRPEVSEWVSILDGGITALPFMVLTLLSVLCLLLTRIRRDWVHFVVLFLIAAQGFQHVRHMAFLAIVFGYWMPPHIQSLWQRVVAWRPSLGVSEPLTPMSARWLQLQLGLINLGLAGGLIYSFAAFGVDRREYPVSAIEFMDREHISGRLVVTFDWAQYALAALAPDTTVGFDGRYDTCYPQEVVDMNFDLLFGKEMTRRNRSIHSGPIDPQRVLKFANPDLVLLDRRTDQPGIRTVNDDPEWVPLYQDGLSILWGHRDVYDDPSSDRYLPTARRVLSDIVPSGTAQWPGFPRRAGRNAFSPDAAFAAANSGKSSEQIAEGRFQATGRQAAAESL